MISPSEAWARVAEHVRLISASRTVPLHEALGRHLAEDVAVDGPWPSTDRSAMDGFGVRATDGLPAGVRLRVVGESLAGHPFTGAVGPGEAVRIMTGAVVPRGVDAVVPVEETDGFDGQEVELRAPVQPGQHVRRRGSEVAAGSVVLRAGARIRAAEIGVLAVLGRTEVSVRRRPRVGILATGDEVVPIDRQPEPHQVRDSNSHLLAAQVVESGGVAVPRGIAGDAEDVLRARLREALETCDVVVTIGGVSKGTHDLVQSVLEGLGVERRFHGIALKPGKPAFFGTHEAAERCVLVFGLPGNPASCATVFDLIVGPALRAMLGEPVVAAHARVVGVPFRRNRRVQAVPARLRAGEDGVLEARLQEMRPSGDPFALAQADGYALIPSDSDPEEVRVAPLRVFAAGIRW